MSPWWMGYAPWLIGMGGLLLASGFFSASEAALFSLSPADRRRMASGSRTQQLAARLVRDADRLLTAVLFWNLLVNVLYFTIASIVGIGLQQEHGPAFSGPFALGALAALIVLSEVLPKTLAVVQPRWMASWVSLPLEAAIRVVDPLLPVLRHMAQISQRLFCPRFEPEPYLHLRDLERAVELATADDPTGRAEHAPLLQQEQELLQSLVLLSEMRVEELMRPRTQLVLFRPPVEWRHIQDAPPPSGYLFVADPQTDEIIAAISLRRVNPLRPIFAADQTDEVLYVPWCFTVAEALQQMIDQSRPAAVVINEYGETIGVLTLEDVLESLFQPTSSRTQRLLHRPSLRQVRPGVWEAAGITSLRRIVRHFRIERPPAHAATVAGLFLEQLGRFPAPGDTCRWGPLEFRVISVWQPAQMLVEVRLLPEEHSP